MLSGDNFPGPRLERWNQEKARSRSLNEYAAGITSVARKVGGKVKNIRHRKRSSWAQLAGCFAIGDLCHVFPIDGKDRRERLTGQNARTLGHGPRLIRKVHTTLTRWIPCLRNGINTVGSS